MRAICASVSVSSSILVRRNCSRWALSMCIALPLVLPEEPLPVRGHPSALTDGTRPAPCNGDTQRGLPLVFSGVPGAIAGIWHMFHICTIAPGTPLCGERAAVRGLLARATRPATCGHPSIPACSPRALTPGHAPQGALTAAMGTHLIRLKPMGTTPTP